MNRKYDVIIFGASGYTGEYIVEEAVNCLKPGSNTTKFTWAIAGRSEKKLQETLDKITKLTGVDIKNVAKILASSGDMETLRQMAAQCSVVMDTVGPYATYGEDVVKACLAEGTHHVDISGEPHFLEKMQALYSEVAKAKGVYIVGPCGYGSIPVDCGVTYLQQNFKGEINAIECYSTLGFKNILKGWGMNTGTWNTAIHVLANLEQLKEFRQKLFPCPLPDSKYRLKRKSRLHYNKEIGSWCTTFFGMDESVVERSQYLNYTQEKTRPVQFNAYSYFPFPLPTILTFLALCFYFVLSQFKIGLQLLETYPQIFTFGIFKHGGPTREQAANLTFKFILTAHGWNEKLAEPSDQHATPPQKKLQLVVSGDNPAYGATAVMMLQSALTIVQEKDKMPLKGGVYPPGYAFAKTSLVDRIKPRGIEFRLSSNL